MGSYFAETEALYQRALTIRTTVLGPEHPDVASTLNALGKLYQDNRTQSLYEGALAIREKSLGLDALEVADPGNVATFVRDKDPEKARALDARSLAIRLKANDLSALSNNISDLTEQGKYGEAVLVAERRLLFTKQRYGEDHPYVDTALLVLGDLYQHVGRYTDTEPLYQRFLAHEEQKVKDPNEGFTWLFKLAELYLAERRYAEAEPLFKRIIAILEQNFGPDNEQIVPSLDSLAVIYWGQDREAEAEALFKKTATLLRGDSPELAISLIHLAQLYQNQGRYADAEPLFKRSVRIYQAESRDQPSQFSAGP